jgi:rod shape-determining protein MreC
MGAGGLIGRVVAAAHNSATVQLITDGQFKVGVVYGNDQFATVQGQGWGKPLAVNDITSITKVTVGTSMLTDGLTGAQYPMNIPVGTITSVHSVSGATQKVVLATPAADLSTLTYVEVLQWSPAPTGRQPTGPQPT